MHFLSGHISRLVQALIILGCSIEGHITHAQQIIMPERWHSAITYKQSIFRQDTLTICIFGDMMMHANQISNAHKGDNSYDFTTYFRHLEDQISKADIAVANMEFTLAGEPYTGYPCFSAPDVFASYLADIGFDIFLAANNHIFDKGSSGAQRTLDIYRDMEEERGIRFTGLAGNEDEYNRVNPLTIIRKGIKISFVNLTYGTNVGSGTAWPKTFRLNHAESVIGALSKAEELDADLTIVLPHWGTEYNLKHSEAQEKAAVMLAEHGADIIVGAHPHVVQDCQILEVNDNEKQVPVAYSLGNAVSNMSAPDTQIGLMTTIKIVRENNGDIRTLPIEFTYLWCSRPGGYCSSYTVIPVEEFIGTRAQWLGSWEYDKMISTYERVRRKTGIE